MIALSIVEIRDFMNKLLCKETFDNFLLKEAVIQSSVTWSLDGTLVTGFFSKESSISFFIVSTAYFDA